MIDLDKLDEYTRKRVESDIAEMKRRDNATDKFLKEIFLSKICNVDEFLSDARTYDILKDYTEKTGGKTKSTRLQLAVIKRMKEKNCNE